MIDQVIAWFRQHPGFGELQASFTELARLAITALGPTVPPLAVPAGLMEMRTMLATQGERWITKWRAEGEAKGRAEGVAQGQADLLLRQLRHRFPGLPVRIEDQVRAASSARLEEWSLRLLDGAKLDGIFTDGQET